jgi:formamidopyrimidine-DNA glycosylase
MPELPEVEATRLNLDRWTHNATLTAVATDPPSNDLDPLVGQRLGPWRRQGKRLACDLASGLGIPPSSGTLLVQLGMTGRLVKDAPPDRPYQRVILTLSTTPTTRISLIDLRRLGRVALVPSLADAFAGLGPDALTTQFDPASLRAALRTSRAPIKSALMDQSILSGLGNIAVLEACFRAKLHPLRPASSLTDAELTRLAPAITAHLTDTLATTVGHDEIAYVSEGGDNPFLVYGREHEPCPSCATRVLRSLQGGRPVFWCPACQPAPPTEKHLDQRVSRSSRQS